jgi:hypothetical protein
MQMLIGLTNTSTYCNANNKMNKCRQSSRTSMPKQSQGTSSNQTPKYTSKCHCVNSGNIIQLNQPSQKTTSHGSCPAAGNASVLCGNATTSNTPTNARGEAPREPGGANILRQTLMAKPRQCPWRESKKQNMNQTHWHNQKHLTAIATATGLTHCRRRHSAPDPTVFKAPTQMLKTALSGLAPLLCPLKCPLTYGKSRRLAASSAWQQAHNIEVLHGGCNEQAQEPVVKVEEQVCNIRRATSQKHGHGEPTTTTATTKLHGLQGPSAT